MNYFLPTTYAAETVAQPPTSGFAAGATALGINGKLLAAQIVNFVILVIILQRFLYKPLVGLLEQRRQTIAASLKKAEEINQQAAEFKVEHEKQINEAKAEAAKIIANAKTAAESLRQDLLKTAQTESEKIMSRTKEEIRREKGQMMSELKHEVGKLVVLATSRIIKKQLDPAVKKQMVEEATREVRL